LTGFDVSRSIRAVRVLCHAQRFKGIGHFVRMHAIARGMSEAHEVYLGHGRVGPEVDNPAPDSYQPRHALPC
jgi:hypothetical protein